ncbi:MAG: biopolymer transporter ExbD [Bacteroidales bacterium]|nr:biopolymer transporter ExbD [Bacteroidales bacterium]
MARKNRPLPQIPNASMADIAFMLLIFFLVTTTMDVDSGIYRTLPQWVEKTVNQPKIKERNVFVVQINRNNDLAIEGEPANINELKDRVKEFILNPNNQANLSEKETRFVEGLGDIIWSKGVVSLQNSRSTDYWAYIQVQNELVAAFNELRDEFAMKQYSAPFDKLTDAQKDIVKKAVPPAISEAEPVDYSK